MKKNISAVMIAATLFIACNNSKTETAAKEDTTTTTTATPTEVAAGPDQSTPKGVAEMVFGAAKSGDYSKLKDLCDASLDTDGDAKHICDVSTGDDELKAQFKEHFSKGTVTGEPVIEGDNAKVDILFGPDGTKKETLNMAKKDGKWYLTSF
jgi:PBP1b-binding outer membrane lipoprotein LpoB